MGAEALFGNLRKGAEAKYTSVVDENVESSERGIRFFKQSCDI